jgi:hypothetical protein
MFPDQRVLLLASAEQEAGSLQKSPEANGDLIRVASLAEAQARLEEGSYSILFCAWSSYVAAAGGALNEIRERYPKTHVIVLPRAGI